MRTWRPQSNAVGERASIAVANKAVYSEGSSGGEFEGMGSTVVAALVRGASLAIVMHETASTSLAQTAIPATGSVVLVP